MTATTATGTTGKGSAVDVAGFWSAGGVTLICSTGIASRTADRKQPIIHDCNAQTVPAGGHLSPRGPGVCFWVIDLGRTESRVAACDVDSLQRQNTSGYASSRPHTGVGIEAT
jgi:hypothetical protein